MSLIAATSQTPSAPKQQISLRKVGEIQRKNPGGTGAGDLHVTLRTL